MKKVIGLIALVVFALGIFLCIKVFLFKSKEEKAIIYALEDSHFDYEIKKDEENKVLEYYVIGNENFFTVVSRFNEYLSENQDFSINNDYSIRLNFSELNHRETYALFTNSFDNDESRHKLIDIIYLQNVSLTRFTNIEAKADFEILYCVGMNKNNLFAVDKFPNLSEIYCDYADGSDEYNEMKEQIALTKPECKVFPRLQENQ